MKNSTAEPRINLLPSGYPVKGTSANRRLLVKIIGQRSNELMEAVAVAFESMPKWQREAANFGGSRQEYLELQFRGFIDYLSLHMQSADNIYTSLFVGELTKALYVAVEAQGEMSRERGAVVDALCAGISAILAPSLAVTEFSRVEAFLDAVRGIVLAEPARTGRVLFVGDCLFLDVVAFLMPGLLADGIHLAADFAAQKGRVALHDQLRAFSATKYDLIVFSPLSYEFSADFSALLGWRCAWADRQKIGDVVDRVWGETQPTLDLLADLFDCAVYVHNTAAVFREESAVKRRVKLKLTERVRRISGGAFNDLLAAYVERKNLESYRHLYIFDEAKLIRGAGEFEAGAYLYKSPLQHPAVFGQLLGRAYTDIIYVHLYMLKGKVIVCDLDNTLWEGVIGEGNVTHFHERQLLLRDIRKKGVVLAINSKNDPKNVKWEGGTLTQDDFVAEAISWEPKVIGMRNIQDSLNLKIKDYVFIDDREDELELMRRAFPETLCLDATDNRVWARIRHWCDTLEVDLDMDRTLMYKQREARKTVLREGVMSLDERQSMFAALGLRLTVRQSAHSDIKRIAELINRTNQFNLEGSRTAFQEVKEWHDSPNHFVVLGQTADRFGDMGVTCIAVLERRASDAQILSFVLSCRVFGYGIETAMMNVLKRLAWDHGATRMLGRYIETPHNGPCRDFLPNSGFRQVGDHWECGQVDAQQQNPAWLEITIA